MKLISFRRCGQISYGAILDDRIADLGSLAGPDAKDLISAIRQNVIAELAQRAAFDIPAEDVELLPVVPNPGKIFCVGHNYETHRQETGRAKVAYPSIFTRFADTLTPHRGPIVRPASSTMLDYEGELAIIIGKAGRHIAEADAMAHIAGFTCANDASVRDWQWHTQQFTPGKNFPATGALGPWLVTPDEITDLDAVTVTTRLNGQQVQHASLADLIFPLPTIIAYLSAFTPLSPGDLILTGTPGGVGAKREPPLWMKAGDVIEVEIAGVGLLSNTVTDEA